MSTLVDFNLRALDRALAELGGADQNREPLDPESFASGPPITIATRAGTLNLVPAPWGTRGYEDLRIRGNRENLGRSLRPPIASKVDLVRMLDASPRAEDDAGAISTPRVSSAVPWTTRANPGLVGVREPRRPRPRQRG